MKTCESVAWNFNNPQDFRLLCGKPAKYIRPAVAALQRIAVCGTHKNAENRRLTKMGVAARCTKIEVEP